MLEDLHSECPGHKGSELGGVGGVKLGLSKLNKREGHDGCDDDDTTFIQDVFGDDCLIVTM